MSDPSTTEFDRISMLTTVAGPTDGTADANEDSGTAEVELLDLLATDVHKRLRILALIGAGAFCAGTIIALVVPVLLDKPVRTTIVMSGLCAFLTILSMLAWMFGHQLQRSRQQITSVGLAYVVCAAAAMAIAEVMLRQPNQVGYDGIPGFCIWIVLFPMIIPCRPRAALLTAMLSAASLPLAYGLAVSIGKDPLPFAMVIDWTIPAFFCAGLAVVAAASVSRLSRALEAARERIREMGSYELLHKLGEGGMGEVWRARHRLLAREAAVKLIKPLLNKDTDNDNVQGLATRFRREAQAIAQLSSPHTIRIYDYGVNDDGELFYAMELLQGLDLGELVNRDGPQPAARTIAILQQICRSLHEAHDKGLVHRDIKPGNIMLCRQGMEVDIVKVLDFGIVGAVQAAAGQTFTGNGQSGIAGTPGFIAPENLIGDAPPDPRADLYAIGAVGYFLLTGSTVFPDGEGGEDLVAHSIDTPKAPSALAAHGVPAALDELLLQCLAKQAKQRPATAKDLDQALRSIECEEPWTNAQAQAWWLTHAH